MVYNCQPLSFPTANFRPKQIAAGDQHSVLLDNTNNLYIWGDNSKGQLGLGHTKEVDRINIVDFTDNDPIVDVKAKGNSTLAITESGAAYFWPVQKTTGEVIARPVLLHLPNKVAIRSGSCGHNFTILVTKSGLVYSFGKDNSAGQLGFGDTFAREVPTLIQSIKDDGEKIVQAFCGYKHVICKTSLGKIYVWGWGGQGQLGLGNLKDQHSPYQVNLSSFNAYHKSKALQVQAGYRHSIILLEDKRIYWTGTTGYLKEQKQFVEVDLSEKIPNYKKSTDFTPVRLMTTWSRSMSITYITIADCRTLDLTSQIKTKIITTLTQKIEDSSAFCDLDPPYVETIAKYFSAKLMKVAPSPQVANGGKNDQKVSGKTTSTPIKNGHSKTKSIDLGNKSNGFGSLSGDNGIHYRNGNGTASATKAQDLDW